MKQTQVGGPAWESDSDQSTEAPAELGHIPVLYQSVLEYLSVKPGGCYLDGTVGAGGHAAAILEASAPHGRLLAMDRDPAALSFAGRRLSRFGDRVILLHASYAEMTEQAPRLGFAPLDGILLDLGLSSRQLDDPARGFAFRYDGPLDMRFDPNDEQTAGVLVNELPVDQLADILYRYGEERDSRRIARLIVAARPLHTTGQLASVVSSAVRRRTGIDPATRVFQALRIAVNRELEALSEGLPQAVRLLRPGGRLVIIAFHSLEDRIVKRFFRRESRECLCPPEQPVCTCQHQATLNILTHKPIRPSGDEVERNPRCRSARMRAAERK
jgi:16S rRNA (cytosine1402-N4)-methyltransferase